MPKLRSATIVLVLGILAINQTAWAAGEPKGESGMRHACQEDVKKFCPDVKPGEGRMHQCLSQHEAELSKACRDSRAQAKAKLEKFEQACRADIEKHCDNVQAGGGRITKCLKAKEAELSPACKTEVQASRGTGKKSSEK